MTKVNISYLVQAMTTGKWYCNYLKNQADLLPGFEA